jgi:pSer/pThr/pTyr-binding forkhead associated (FHA) protein
MFRVTVTDHRGENPAVTTVDGNELHIGRVPGNDLVLPTSKVSKRHARMAIEDGRIVVTDLRSTNGTIFRDSRITGPTVLAEGDAVVIGEFLVRIDQAFYAEGDELSLPGQIRA